MTLVNIHRCFERAVFIGCYERATILISSWWSGKLNNELSAYCFFLCFNELNALLLFKYQYNSPHECFLVRFAKVKHPRINSFSLNGFAFALKRFRCVECELVTLETKLIPLIFIVSARARRLPSVVNKTILSLCAVCARKRQRTINNLSSSVFGCLTVVYPKQPVSEFKGWFANAWALTSDWVIHWQVNLSELVQCDVRGKLIRVDHSSRKNVRCNQNVNWVFLLFLLMCRPTRR